MASIMDFFRLSYIKTCSYSNYVILCDSKSALQHLARCSSSIRGLPIAYVIIDSLLELQRIDVNVKFQWVPSHIGLTGNEQADELAQLGAHSGIVVHQPPFFTDLLPDLKNNCHNLWKTHFDERSMEKGDWYRTLCNEPPKIPWFISIKADRIRLTTLMRLRSGHVPLNAFGHMMKVCMSPDCSLCKKREDVYHDLVECAGVESEGRRFEADAGVALTQLGCVSAILAQPKDPVCWGLVNLYLNFIKSRAN